MDLVGAPEGAVGALVDAVVGEVQRGEEHDAVAVDPVLDRERRLVDLKRQDRRGQDSSKGEPPRSVALSKEPPTNNSQPPTARSPPSLSVIFTTAKNIFSSFSSSPSLFFDLFEVGTRDDERKPPNLAV